MAIARVRAAHEFFLNMKGLAGLAETNLLYYNI
jgi:hypothetical protein